MGNLGEPRQQVGLPKEDLGRWTKARAESLRPQAPVVVHRAWSLCDPPYWRERSFHLAGERWDGPGRSCHGESGGLVPGAQP